MGHVLDSTMEVLNDIVEPHLSSPQLSGCSDYPTIELMIFIGFLLYIK